MDGAEVHRTALVDPSARLGAGSVVGAYSILGAGTELGVDCVVAEHVVLRPRTVVGARTTIDSFSVIGGDPQDLGFDRSLPSRVEIGADSILRESVTIHRSSVEGGVTRIGDRVYMMANSHAAHDCVVGDRVVLVQSAMLAGHVHAGHDTMVGGGVGVHQHVRLGPGAMLGGNAVATYDVPPFTMIVDRNGLRGLNLVGLRRLGASPDDLADLKRCYHEVYREGDPRVRAAAALASGGFGLASFGREFLEFFAAGERGFVRPRRAGRLERAGE